VIAYPVALAALSLGAVGLERGLAWRSAQPQLRKGLGWDALHLVFNGHFLGVILYSLATRFWVDPGWEGTAQDWPLWLQAGLAIVVLDFLQWCIHNLLHRVPFLWSFHKLHHGVRDGEMDWIVSFRFQWTEVVVYKAALVMPLAWMGFSVEAMWIQAVVGTAIGHLNHANLPWTYGPLRYVLNNPAMHIWHHDHDGPATNFGIVLSCWDWIFGTAQMPDHPPAKLGYPGMEELPDDFFGQQVWQLGRWIPAGVSRWVLPLIGALLLGAAWWVAAG
jgi:sterol desaturase/sphingolipid hydroxylase (fatty acid hydroxylase superfamily)